MVETQNVAANSVCSDISLAHESDADEFPPDAAPDDGRARGRRGDEDGWRGQGGGGARTAMMERAMEPWTAARYPHAPTAACRHSSLPTKPLTA